MQEEISFGVWLRKQRRTLDLTRQAFADQVGCAEVTLRRIEAGTLKPSKELANLLLGQLSIPESERSEWVSFARGLSGFPLQSNKSSSKLRTNLPAPITTFIGREKERAEVVELITKHRLVTLTGSGGVGKTRLSIRVGEEALSRYADGVWLVELAPILDPSIVPYTVAVSIGLREDPQRRIIDMLCDYLRDKTMLLLLDNCEHLLDACAHLIDTILKACPNLKILLTSREPLNIIGEAIYRVPSLKLPDAQQMIDTFRNYESIQLFEERAQLVQFDFSLTLENIASVAQICQRLDGIPLAIELAAAKAAMLSTEQIAEKLHESFNLLVQGSRTALPRHQTLRACIAWSWNLLTESEQSLMQQLSIFVGGWTLEAAQSVCEGDVLHMLNSLVTKSLVVMNQRADVRYYFHETIRQYAVDKLLEAGGIKALRDKHLAYFVRLIEQAEPELYRSNQISWYKQLDDELDNFRKAFEWSLATDIRSGLQIAAVPWRFWLTRGYYGELGTWLAEFLKRYETVDTLHAQALAIYADSAFVQGNFPDAIALAEQSLQMAHTLSDERLEAFSLSFLGLYIQAQGDTERGVYLLEQSLAIYRSLGDKIGQADVLMWFPNDRDIERSWNYFKDSLKLHRELGNLSGIAESLQGLALATIKMGDISSPSAWLEEAVSISRLLGKHTSAWAIARFGDLTYWQGDYTRANEYYEEALTLCEITGNNLLSLWIRTNIAYTIFWQGDIQRAREMFYDTIQRMQKAGLIIGIVYAIEGLASMYTFQGHLIRAIRLFAWADFIREQTSYGRMPIEHKSVEKDLAIIHSRLDDTKFAKLSEEGRAMTVEEAIKLALEAT